MRRPLTPIGRCSRRLRRRLEIEEELALAWRIKIRRKFLEPDPAVKIRGGRWVIPASFAVPGPFWDRPTSPQGYVSFHFRWTTVSRDSSGKSVISDSRGKIQHKQSSPGDHDKYIAREDAVMTISPDNFDGYAARIAAAGSSTGPVEVALMTNISRDPEVRANFWSAVHATARKAGPDRLILEPSRASQKDWKVLAAADNVPSGIREIAAQFAAGSQSRKIELPMTAEEAASAIELICSSIPAADRKKGPVRFARGRKGRTQYRLETELPHGLDDAARVRIMVRMAEEVEATGAMYTLVIHEPDAHNDLRNYHLHLIAHDRPACLIDGKWDFTIATPVQGQSGRMNFKERRNKIVIPTLRTSSNRGDFDAFLKALRHKFADFCNAELREAGNTRLFDPRSYIEMGIDREPTQKLGTRLAPLEAAGVATVKGCLNAEIIWSYELQTRVNNCAPSRETRQETLDGLRVSIDRLTPSDPRAANAYFALDRAIKAAQFLDLVEPELAEYDVTLAMARARPMKTIDQCSRILNELEAGGGSSTDRRNKNRILRRRDEAAEFLKTIEQIDRENQNVFADQGPLIAEAHSDLMAAANFIGNLASLMRSSASETISSLPSTTQIDTPSTSTPMIPVSTAPKLETASAATGPTVKPMTSPTTPHPQLDLASVIARIVDDRLIVLGPEHHDGAGYRAAGVTRAELQILRDPDNMGQAQAELAEIARNQIDLIRRTHLLHQSYGAVNSANTSRGATRPATTPSSPLEILQDYRQHPLAARLMCWETPELEHSSDKKPSLWRRVRSMIGETVSDFENQPELRIEMGLEATSPVLEPRPVLPAIQPAAPSRDEAISAYAAEITTNPEVAFLLIEGKPRVDPSSVPDWKWCVHAFEDHEEVRKAVGDRWEKEQKKTQAVERHQQLVDQHRARRRAQLVAAFEAGDLIARKDNGRWIINGQDEDLRYLAGQWCDHPEIASVLENSARSPRPISPTLANTVPNQSDAEKPDPNLLGFRMAATPAISSQSPASTPSENDILTEQNWFINKGGKGR